MNDFVFHQPYLLWLLLLLPILFWLRGRLAARASILFPATPIATALSRQSKQKAGGFSLLWPWLVLTLIIIALARPQEAKYFSESESSGVDIVIALDLSPSMMALDLASSDDIVTRLDIAKEVTQEFVRKRPHDRIGLIAFAGQPYLVSPLTLNHDWLEQNLARLHCNLLAQKGTAIGSAVGMSVNRLKDLQAQSRIVILITDGENNAGSISPKTAAEVAASFSSTVYTIGIGQENDARLPFYNDDGSLRRDNLGRIRMSRMVVGPVDEETLKEISSITGGKYYRATNREELSAVYDEIDQLEKTKITIKEFAEVEELFYWPLGLAVLIALLQRITQLFWRNPLP